MIDEFRINHRLLNGSVACESSRAFIVFKSVYIMAKKYDNDKGFLIIEMSFDEATLLCNFGCETSEDNYIVVCDNCNSKFDEKDNIYYFSVLNRAMCKECCDDIIANQDRYNEDIPYEVRHYNYYAEFLNLDKV